MYKRLTYILLAMLPFFANSQEHEDPETTTLLRREYLAGINFNANGGATGWGFAFDYGFQKNYKYKNTIGFTLTNIRHEKEFKIYGNTLNNSKGYYYGKLRSVVAFRPTYGGKLLLFQAKRENGIEISAKWSLGPSIGLVKPVYLKIEKFNAPAKDEKYDPSIHHTGNIASRSPWYKGLGESELRLGIYSKLGFDFNFSTDRGSIRGGEVGAMVDYFVGREIEILYDNDNRNIFASLYLQFNLGQKLY